MIDKNKLIEYCGALGIEISSECADKLDLYAYLLVEGNKKCNLTAITAPDDILIKHFLDSLTGLTVLNTLFEEYTCYDGVDVGSGAGFPGVVLAVADPKLKLTVIDSSQKRIDFINFISEKLCVSVQAVHSRAEDASHLPPFRQSFDVSFSRAVAQLNILAEYCIPFVKAGGYFIAYKGKNSSDEYNSSLNAFSFLNSSLFEVKSFVLPDDSDRTLYIYKSDGSIDEKYPRRSSKITKYPL